MQRVVILFLMTCLLFQSGCQVMSNCLRDGILGGLAHRFDTSRPENERQSAYNAYVQEHAR